MAGKISKRLLEIVDALPLRTGARVLEIGCGPGVAAREIVSRFEDIYVLAIDRSEKAIDQAKKLSNTEIESGKIRFIQSKIEDFDLPEDEELFDIVFAIRVGVLDGRHPHGEKRAQENIARCLKRNGKLFIDGGEPLKEVDLGTRHSDKVSE